MATRFVGTGRIPLLLLGFCQVLTVLVCWLLQKRLEILCYRYVDVGHMIQDCAQTVLHMLRCALLVCLVGLVIPGLVVVLCGLVGCCSQLLCRLHSLKDLGSLGLCYPQGSDVFCVSVLDVVNSSCSL